jgi:polysaccharide export outer membrane protein
MAFGRFLCFTILIVLLGLAINQQAAAQDTKSPAPPAAPSAGQAVQNDAGDPAKTPAVFPDAAAKESAAPTESAVAAEPGMPARQNSPAAQLRIGGGDLLNISVYGLPDFAQDVRVNSSGDAYLPLIGYVQLAGLTPDQAQAVIENRLREGEFVKNPHVTVFLKEYVNQSATVTGEVNRPGVYPMLGSRRLLEVLANAGGLTTRAGKTVTITHRDHPEEPVKVTLPSDLAKSPKENIEIFPGDTVVVNRAGVVYVVGEVARPSGLVMDNYEKMTVMQAIALVGGTTSVAAMNNAKLIRTTATGREELELPLKKILYAKQADVDLKPDDIIFVPASFGKKAAKRSVDSVLAVTQGLALYHP